MELGIYIGGRFGKALNMSMVECFFLCQYAGRGVLFERLSIWNEEKYRHLQGTSPIIFLNYTSVKATEYNNFIKVLLKDDVDAVNELMNDIALNTFSHFDIACPKCGYKRLPQTLLSWICAWINSGT